MRLGRGAGRLPTGPGAPSGVPEGHPGPNYSGHFPSLPGVDLSNLHQKLTTGRQPDIFSDKKTDGKSYTKFWILQGGYRGRGRGPPPIPPPLKIQLFASDVPCDLFEKVTGCHPVTGKFMLIIVFPFARTCGFCGGSRFGPPEVSVHGE